MQLVRLCMAGEGIQFINPKEVNIPNTANFVELSDEPSKEELEEHQLYELVDDLPELGPLQRMQVVSITPDEETRTVTRCYEVVDYTAHEAETHLRERIKQFHALEAEGVRYDGVFVDALGEKLEAAKVPVYYDVFSLTQMVESGQIAIHVYGNAFIMAGDKEAAALYEEQRVKYIRSKSIVLAGAMQALGLQNANAMRIAYGELEKLIATWLGEK
ncbi:hypothetical protein CZP2022_275 [Vibrio phage C-ZP2022]|nr:hypothetical protein CZP2022_275 [Vibrio phage C-ZP2022]